MKGSERVTDKTYLNLSRSASALSVFTICASFIAALSSSAEAYVSLAVTAISLVLMTVGYLLQLLIFKAIGHKIKLGQNGYESTVRHYSAVKALPVLILSGVLGVISYSVSVDYFIPDSLFPILIGAVAACPLIIGSSVCFYPNHRLVSLKSLVASVPLFGIVFFITAGISNGGIAYIAPSACLILHAATTLVTLNQTNMTKTYIGTVTSFASVKDKLYNARLVAISLAIVAVGTLLTYTVLNGLKTTFLMVLALFIFNNRSESFENDYGNTDGERLDQVLSEFLYGKKDPSGAINYYFYIVFVILIIVLVVSLAVLWFRSGQGIKGAFRALIARIIEFLSGLFSRAPKDTPTASTLPSYVDYEQKLVYDTDPKLDATDAFRQFMRRLDSMPSPQKRLEYAYSTFVSLLNRVPINIKKSDTPRQIKKRLASSSPILTSETVSEITRHYESVAYSANPATDAECAAAERALVSVIRRILT